jgi:cytochrome c oxidase subunit IV
MSTSIDTTGHAPAADTHGSEHAHPSDLKYIKIAIVLAVLTAAEVATYFFEDDISRGWLVAILIPMMIVKFAIVAGYFMHLKFDSPLFTRMFAAGLAFAVVVYIIMLLTFEYWG